MDEWNTREFAARKDKPYAELRGEWIAAHEAARAALEAATDDTLNAAYGQGTIAAYYTGDTTEHYQEHAEQIRDWLHEMETTEK